MRKTIDVTISASGRDEGKTYRLTEMPAARAEKWAMRAFLGMARSGIEVPDSISEAGLAGIAMIGLRAVGSMSFGDAEPLMDEMVACIQYVEPSVNGRVPVVRGLVESDIEEIATRVKLRKEVFGLHVDFSALAARLKSAQASSSEEAAPTT